MKFEMNHIWAVAFISAERGLLLVKTYTGSLDSKGFGNCVEQVYVKM